MKLLISILLVLLVTACQVDPYTHSPNWGVTDWYSAGKDDAVSGLAVKDNETLADDWNDSNIDRPRYLKGYADGLEKICQQHLLYAWGLSGKSFPSGCDTREDIRQLREAWQTGTDEGVRASRLN